MIALSTTIPKNEGHGLIIEEITPDNYIFGGESKVEQKVIQANGQWELFLPEKEIQKINGFETNACYIYGTNNGIEILENRLFGTLSNYSERFVARAVNHTLAGGNPHKACEAVRYISGEISEKDMPFDGTISTLEQYVGSLPPRALVEKGKKWIDKFDFKHEWVFMPADKYKHELMMEALKYSPLGVSVYAWKYDEQIGLYYKEPYDKDNHWVTVYGYVAGLFWWIFDSYDNTFKKVKWDTDFTIAKRYWLAERGVKPKRWWFFYL